MSQQDYEAGARRMAAHLLLAVEATHEQLFAALERIPQRRGEQPLLESMRAGVGLAHDTAVGGLETIRNLVTLVQQQGLGEWYAYDQQQGNGND